MKVRTETRYRFECEVELDIEPQGSSSGQPYWPDCDEKAAQAARHYLPAAEKALRKARKDRKISHEEFSIDLGIELRGRKLFAVFQSTGRKNR